MLKQLIFDSGVKAANGQTHVIGHWTAPRRIYVRSVLCWIGGAAGQYIDISCTVFSTGLPVLLFFGQDRYAPPNGVHQWKDEYGPGDAVVEAGGQIAAHFGGQVLGVVDPAPPVHCLVIVNYEENP